MASHVFVVDSRARKARVATTPSTYMSDVLQKGCEKLGLKEQYTHRHNNKAVDLSRTVRLAGLPSGAQLQLVQASRSPTVVTVALQLPASDGNKRYTHKVPSTSSLWEILRIVESQEKLNITERAASSTQNGSGRLFHEMPQVNLLNRELGTFVDLQKTLSQFGVSSGNILLRLTFKQTETPLEEAMQQISHYFKTEPVAPTATTVTAATQSPTATEDTPMPDAAATPEPSVKATEGAAHASNSVSTTTDAAAPSSSAPSLSETNENTASHSTPAVTVYTPPSNSTPSAAQTSYDEADYVPSVEHASLHQARLLASSRNKRLPSDKEIAARESERKVKQDAVKSVRVRVRLPDQAMLESSFARGKTGQDVYGLVRGNLRDEIANKVKFSLRYVNEKGAHVTLPDDGTYDLIVKAGWRGSVLVSMVWDDSVSTELRKGPVLRADVLSQAKALQVNTNQSSGNADDDDDKKSGFLGGLFKKETKPKMGSAEKEAKLKNLLGFKKK